jgi:hypothetical protein
VKQLAALLRVSGWLCGLCVRKKVLKLQHVGGLDQGLAGQKDLYWQPTGTQMGGSEALLSDG